MLGRLYLRRSRSYAIRQRVIAKRYYCNKHEDPAPNHEEKLRQEAAKNKHKEDEDMDPSTKMVIAPPEPDAEEYRRISGRTEDKRPISLGWVRCSITCIFLHYTANR